MAINVLTSLDGARMTGVFEGEAKLLATSTVADIGTGSTDASIANKKYVDESLSDLIGGAPEALNTLFELSKALNDDKDFSNTVSTAIGKAPSYIYDDGKGSLTLKTPSDAELATSGNRGSKVSSLNGRSVIDLSSVHSITISGTEVTITYGNGSVSKYNTQDTTYKETTSEKAGLFSTAYKSKLDRIDDGANKYVLPAASVTTLGGVKIPSGANITLNNGALSLTSANVIAALNYTPAGTDTASAQKSGLMSATDKSNLDALPAKNAVFTWGRLAAKS